MYTIYMYTIYNAEDASLYMEKGDGSERTHTQMRRRMISPTGRSRAFTASIADGRRADCDPSIYIHTHLYNYTHDYIQIDRLHPTFGESPKIALIPYYHRFSQTDLFGFIFPTIVDNRFINRFVNDISQAPDSGKE
jgi:hypothetical protein